MNFLLNQTVILTAITILAIFGGMGWFVYKMYILSKTPEEPQQKK